MPNKTTPQTPAEALLLLLDQVDYTRDACRPNEAIGALVTPEVLKQCREASRPPWTMDLPGNQKELLGKFNMSDLPTDWEMGVEILIANNGKTLWVNVGPKCALRVNHIQGQVTIDDQRPKDMKSKRAE